MEHFTKATEGWEEIYHYKKMFYKGILHMELEEFDEALSAFNESWKLKNKEYHSIGHKILARRAYCNIKLGNRTVCLKLFFSRELLNRDFRKPNKTSN